MNSTLKKLIVLAVIALLGYLAYLGVESLMKKMQPKNPYPTDPATTVFDFFDAMQAEDYQSCYGLLDPQRKAATVIRKQSRGAGYFPHFERIRQYLTQYVGQDFASVLEVSEDGRQAFFNDIVLNIKISSAKGLDKKMHYSIAEIVDFPIDATPGIGLEAHNRQMNKIMGSLAATSDDDITEIIKQNDYENSRERFQRLTDAFTANRQLDTKHQLLDWIVKEYAADRNLPAWLNKIANDDITPQHLRTLAANYVKQLPAK